jgi:uncharacterized protein
MRIGIISDTHGWLDPKVETYFSDCEEIWHAGDIGNLDLAESLAKGKKLRAVYGNIDGGLQRIDFPENHIFDVAGIRVLLTHIAGAPGKYNPRVKRLINEFKPKLLVCGHSHILRVERDPVYDNLLYLNPGAAGVHGFHKVKTLLRIEIEQGKIKKAEAIELGLRSKID